jgi:two-component system, OmpR family, response regulator
MGSYEAIKRELAQSLEMANSKTRILYTEDDADTRELVTLVLSLAGCEVVGTDSEEFALTLAKTGHFDLYLIDNRLANSTGEELCQRLREFDVKTPILFYSGSAYDSDRNSALQNGAQGYLTKPAENQQLVNEVFRLISGSKPAAQFNDQVQDRFISAGI